MKLSAPITISVLLALTAGLPAAAQTGTEQPPAPAWLAEETVCPWENVEDNPRLARVCLQAAGVNTGLAEYAFAEEPWDYDPDTPTPSGTPEEAGLVSRWAMGEAIHRMIETAVETAGGQTPGLPANHRTFFTDVGWLGEDTRRKLELLFHWGITTGTNVYGEYSPTQTVTRAQMARFFARALAAIDRFTDGEGTPRFEADNTWQTLGRNTDAFEIPAPFADVQAGKPPAGILDRGLLGAVSILYDLGITRGAGSDADGNPVYRPELNVSGDQMAMFLVRILAHTSVRVTEETPDLTAVELPEIQQDGSTVELQGNSGNRLLPRGTVLTPSPSVRPPREIDIYSYVETDDRFEVYASGERFNLSEPLSLQIGDWYWSQPQGDEHETLSIVVGFRAHTSYVKETWPMQLVYYCVVMEGHEWHRRHHIEIALQVSPGVFRLATTTTISEGEMLAAGECDPAEYGISEPAGGYTHAYPCATRSEKYRQKFASECRT